MASQQDESGESTPTNSTSRGPTGRIKKESNGALSPADLATILAALKAQSNARTLDSVAQTMLHYEQVGKAL